MFDNRLIIENCEVNWPPKSSDLTPLPYFLWDVVKENGYADQPEAFEVFKVNIRNAIVDIRPHKIEKGRMNEVL